jgi:hypothetical protein
LAPTRPPPNLHSWCKVLGVRILNWGPHQPHHRLRRHQHRSHSKECPRRGSRVCRPAR